MKNINILKDLKTLNKLHTSSVESYTTNNGIVDFTCDNAGYVDNVVIEGETLVNLVRTDLPVEIWDNNRVAINLQVCNYLEGTYTLFNFSDKTIVFDIGEVATGTWLRTFALDANKVKTFNINNGERIFNVNGLFTGGWGNNDKSKNEFRNSIVVLEGDHTDKPISYFEGLKSVGQGDNIEVLTTPIHNNLIPQNYTKGEGYWTSMVDVGSVFSDSNWYRILEYIPVKPNTKYTGLYTGTQVVYYDENKNTIYHNQSDLVLGYEYHIFTTPQNAKYIRVSYPKNIEDNICIFEGIKHDKKQISTTLRSLPNGVKDTIEKRGNKYVKVQRCGEVTLSGIEDWGYITSFDNVVRYSYFIGGIAYKPNEINCDSDKFKVEKNALWNNDSEQVDVGNGDISINIMKNKLSNTNHADSLNIKTWLQSNPITVVYELATPQIIELPNFNPQTYKGENVLIINSGVIQCDVSFDVCEGIRSELDVIKDKVSSLDCDYVEDIELQFLNGWIKNTNGYYSAKMIDGVVYINLLCSDGIKTARTPICYIKDQKFRPKTSIPFIIGTHTGLYVNGFVQTTGNIVINTEDIPPNSWISICVSYPIL